MLWLIIRKNSYFTSITWMFFPCISMLMVKMHGLALMEGVVILLTWKSERYFTLSAQMQVWHMFVCVSNHNVVHFRSGIHTALKRRRSRQQSRLLACFWESMTLSAVSRRSRLLEPQLQSNPKLKLRAMLTMSRWSQSRGCDEPAPAKLFTSARIALWAEFVLFECWWLALA